MCTHIIRSKKPISQSIRSHNCSPSTPELEHTRTGCSFPLRSDVMCDTRSKNVRSTACFRSTSLAQHAFDFQRRTDFIYCIDTFERVASLIATHITVLPRNTYIPFGRESGANTTLSPANTMYSLIAFVLNVGQSKNATLLQWICIGIASRILFLYRYLRCNNILDLYTLNVLLNQIMLSFTYIFVVFFEYFM